MIDLDIDDLVLGKYKAAMFIIIGLAIVAAIFGVGYATASTIKDLEIARLEKGHHEYQNKLKDEAIMANMIARSAESRAADSIAKSAEIYEQRRQDEKATSDRILNDYRNDVIRLRVLLKKSPTATGAVVPNTATSASTSDGEAEQTLDGAVAARLAQRYFDYNEVVDQLELCQAVVRADRAMLEPAK